MKIVELVRLEENFDEGTFGVLKIDKKVFCMTLELPDRENEVSRSSIPVQQYICRRYNSPKFGETFMVENVPGRSFILFHPGNTDEDTEGCILLGERVGNLIGGNRKTRGILNSRVAFKWFMGEMRDINEFHLTVQEHF